MLNSGVDDIFEAATRQAMLVRAGASAHGTSGLVGGLGTNGRSTLAGGDAMRSERRKSGMMLGGGNGNGANYSGHEEKNGAMGKMNTSKGCCIVA